MRVRGPGVAAAVLLVVAGCGSSRSPGPAAAGPPYVEQDGQPLLSCGGGVSFPPSVLADGIPGVLTQAEVEAGFAELLADPKWADELRLTFLRDGAAGTPWRLLAEDGSTYTLGLGDWTADGPAESAYVMTVHHGAGGWSMVGGGSCRLAPELRGHDDWVGLTLPAGGVDRTSTTPTVGVTETQCASGRDPRPHLRDPYVVETASSVTVYWTSAPITEPATCIGPPPTLVTLPLSSPLGDRELLDGSTYPPRPIPASLLG